MRIAALLCVLLVAAEADAQRFGRRGRTAGGRGRAAFQLPTGPSRQGPAFFSPAAPSGLPEIPEAGPASLEELYELYFDLYFGGGAKSNGQSEIERLGEQIFEDGIISFPVGQACSECHGENAGFAGPDSPINGTLAVMPGAVQSRFGVRRPPGLTYLRDTTPVLSFDSTTGLWNGGVLLDGRGTGFPTGDPLAEQHAFVVSSAIFNPVEQNAPHADDGPAPSSDYLVQAVEDSNWTRRFERLFGPAEPETVATNLSVAIAAFLRSDELNQFDSKWDAVQRGEDTFTVQEAAGEQLFMGAAQCSICHPPPLFTSRNFANVGVPVNPTHPSQIGLTEPQVDLGLGATLRSLGDPQGDADLQDGAFKIPTLRNAFAVPPGQESRFVKALFHNGAIVGPPAEAALQVVQFYNLSQTDESPFGPPEVPQNVVTLIGDLGLTEQEEEDLAAFLLTLTDGWEPPRRTRSRGGFGFRSGVFGGPRFGRRR